MSFVVPSMLIDRVDDSDRVIGSIQRSDVFEQRANFRVVHVIVRNLAGDILLQKIGPGLRHAGEWGSSVAGYLKSGESYRQAAVRKLSEELGVHAMNVTSHGRTRMHDSGCEKFIGVYSLQHAGAFTLRSPPSSDIEFLPEADLRDALRSRQRSFTATFVHVARYLGLDDGGADRDR